LEHGIDSDHRIDGDNNSRGLKRLKTLIADGDAVFARFNVGKRVAPSGVGFRFPALVHSGISNHDAGVCDCRAGRI
jgi:hypothetical protein